MISKTKIIRTDTLDPWWNLAVEEYLIERVEEDACILYLWQNQNTVVIGKNQNAWRECKTELLEKEEGKLARRLSGGGAVFHDTGNLNFTFLMKKENYDLDKQLQVILSAVKSLDIPAEKSGRNDLTVEGRKFSGNAFCFKKYGSYHHGTVLVSADMEKLTKYLQVSKEKIRSKGIESVISRVVNLSEYKPGLNIDMMADAIEEAFIRVYGGNFSKVYNTEEMDQEVLKRLYEKYSSWEWRYGEAPKFDIDLDKRFSWGEIQIGLQLQSGEVKKASVYSDAMDEEFIGMLPEALNGRKFKSQALAESIRSVKAEGERKKLAEDIAAWIEEKGF